jgi:hypothetical protein
VGLDGYRACRNRDRDVRSESVGLASAVPLQWNDSRSTAIPLQLGPGRGNSVHSFSQRTTASVRAPYADGRNLLLNRPLNSLESRLFPRTEDVAGGAVFLAP